MTFNQKFKNCLIDSVANLRELGKEKSYQEIIAESVEKKKRGITVKLFKKVNIFKKIANVWNYFFCNKVYIDDLDSKTLLSILIAYHKYQWAERNDTPENSAEKLVTGLEKQIKGEKDEHDLVVERFEKDITKDS